MIRWLFLLGIIFISAGVVGFAETSAFTGVIAKSVYFFATILLIIALFIRDVYRKETD